MSKNFQKVYNNHSELESNCKNIEILKQKNKLNKECTEKLRIERISIKNNLMSQAVNGIIAFFSSIFGGAMLFTMIYFIIFERNINISFYTIKLAMKSKYFVTLLLIGTTAGMYVGIKELSRMYSKKY